MSKSKKKILFIMQLPPPIHGASVMNHYLINCQLISDSYKTEIINLQFVRSISEISMFSFKKILIAIRFGVIIFSKVYKFKPDLVYFTLSPTGWAFYRDIIYIILLKIFKTKIVYHLHGKGILFNSQKNLVNKYLYGWVFKNAYVICLSKRLIYDIRPFYQKDPYIVPNGIEFQTQSMLPWPSKKTVPCILYLSNFIRSKGVLVLIKSLGILKNKGVDFSAKLVGAPFDLTIETIKDLIDEEGLTNMVTISGPKYGNDKIFEFRQADIFVFPSYYENETFGLVNLEAMQQSLPIVTTFVGGIPDIVIDNETGFLVEPKNAQALADKIGILLQDENLRIEMGKKGHERFMNNYTLAHFENNMNLVFQDILSIR